MFLYFLDTKKRKICKKHHKSLGVIVDFSVFSKYITIEVVAIIDTLESNGFCAFVVGGCVRDMLLGIAPKDFDIATNAKPYEVVEIFTKAGHKCLEIGKQYGTIAVSKTQLEKIDSSANKMPATKKSMDSSTKSSEFIEVTTFRKDSEYKDGRHPKSVEFGNSIYKDLARRDFTINAIAFNPSIKEFIDKFGGLNDLRLKRIACVGDPKSRFSEDYLRLLRALRFSSTLGFSIEKATKETIKAQMQNLDSLSKERVQAEFSKLILGDFATEILREYGEVLTLLFGVDFVDNEILEGIALLNKTPKDLATRLSVLCYALFGGFKGAKSSAKISSIESSKKAKATLKTLKYSNEIIKEVCFLLGFVDRALECVCKAGVEQKIALKMLMRDCEKEAKIAQKRAESLLDFLGFISNQNLATKIQKAKSSLKQILRDEECFCLGGLAINGNEVRAIMQSQNKVAQNRKNDKEIGKILDFLLKSVIKGRVANTKSALKSATKAYLANHKGGA